MEAIVLAGGFGTRLRHIVPDVPKPMAPVCGKPFLEYILDYLSCAGITKVILAVGYKKEVIEAYFQNQYKNLEIVYSEETTPLFTGGAIKQALQLCNDENIFVINGDTYFDVDLFAMKNYHIAHHSDLTLAIREMHNFERYGTLQRKQERIVAFHEKKKMEHGFINGGIYLLRRNLLEQIEEQQFSFETDFMEKQIDKTKIMGYESDGYFIDIGVPEDYAQAQIDFVNRG